MAKIKLKSIKRDLAAKAKDRGNYLIDLGKTEVVVEVEVEAKEQISSATDRWQKVAEAEVDRYQGIVSGEIDKLVEKLRGLVSEIRSEADEKKRQALKRQADALAADTTTSVQGAVRSLQAAVEDAVRKQIDKEAQGDRNLREARIFVALKGAAAVIKIGKDVTELVASGGLDVSAWVSLAKDIVKLAKLIHDQTKGEEKLRQELLKAIGVYCTAKQRRFAERQKADRNWKRQAKQIAREIYKSESSLAKKAEAARKKYRNQVTAMRQEIDKLGTRADKAQAALKKLGGTQFDHETKKKIAAFGTKMINLKSSCGELNNELLRTQKFTDDMAFLLTEAGVTVDERTEQQKLKAFDNLPQAAKAGKQLKDTAESALKIIETLA